VGETPIQTNESASEKPSWLELVRRRVESLRFGEVQIVVQDSQVTQVEKTQRLRFDKAPARKI
jgi:hypothetical protein